MAAIKPSSQETGEAQKHRIRITLTSRNVENLEKGAIFFFLYYYYITIMALAYLLKTNKVVNTLAY